MTLKGSEVQLIKMYPIDRDESRENVDWRQVYVRSVSYFRDPVLIDASFYAGFQLHKETVKGSHWNWCCVEPLFDSKTSWDIPHAWIRTRNDRRWLPYPFDTEEHRWIQNRDERRRLSNSFDGQESSFSIKVEASQEMRTHDLVKRMVNRDEVGDPPVSRHRLSSEGAKYTGLRRGRGWRGQHSF